MTIPSIDPLLQRTERLTAHLPNAVQGGDPAQFALLLSLIANQDEQRAAFTVPVPTPPGQGGDGTSAFRLPEPTYRTLEQLHSPALVARLNQAVQQQLNGDYAYLNSHLISQAQQRHNQPPANDEFAKVALISAGKLLLEQIDQARQSVPA